MEDNVPPPVTATSSVASELTGNDVMLSDFVEQEESSILESQKKEAPKWTNEKHSLYLKLMEASFVDQLYNSSDMKTRKKQKNCCSNSVSSTKNHACTCIASEQFKVLQHGNWSRINYRRDQSQPNAADRPHVSPGNPWIQHFRIRPKHGAVPSLSLQKKLSSPSALEQFRVTEPRSCHQESACSNTEVTDQNFAQEEVNAERDEGSHSRKRVRTSVVSCSSNDQVVPFGTFPPTKMAQ